MNVSFDWVVDVINSDCFSIQNVLLERAFIMNVWKFRIDARIEWSIKNMLLLNASSHCITNMKRTKLLTPLMLCIVAMWVIRTRTEQANMPFLSRASETLKRINIEINISWNSMSVNSSAQASINSVKKSSSMKLNTISEKQRQQSSRVNLMITLGSRLHSVNHQRQSRRSQLRLTLLRQRAHLDLTIEVWLTQL